MEPIDLSALSIDGQLSREWLAVNHLGGYAASTLPGCNTRKYHGLLVAAMSPPVRRMVLLSRVEETVFHDGWPHALACNEYPDAVHPQGHKLLGGENTVVLSYVLEGAKKPIELEIRPLFALRGIHELMYQWNAPLAPENIG